MEKLIGEKCYSVDLRSAWLKYMSSQRLTLYNDYTVNKISYSQNETDLIAVIYCY